MYVICMYIYTHIHTLHIYIYKHTYIYTYIYIYISVWGSSSGSWALNFSVGIHKAFVFLANTKATAYSSEDACKLSA